VRHAVTKLATRRDPLIETDLDVIPLGDRGMRLGVIRAPTSASATRPTTTTAVSVWSSSPVTRLQPVGRETHRKQEREGEALAAPDCDRLELAIRAVQLSDLAPIANTTP
jgi:hypothetical protein